MAEIAAAALMDRLYRRQRHFYDVTRKYYLLGRDRLIEGLAPPPGSRVLEIGCGTARNLVAAAQAWPDAQFYGIDISAEMLATARQRRRPGGPRAPHRAGARRRHGLRPRLAVRRAGLLAHRLLLQPVDDPGLADGARSGAGLAAAGRRAAYRRFRRPAAAAALVPRRPAAAGWPSSMSARATASRPSWRRAGCGWLSSGPTAITPSTRSAAASRNRLRSIGKSGALAVTIQRAAWPLCL